MLFIKVTTYAADTIQERVRTILSRYQGKALGRFQGQKEHDDFHTLIENSAFHLQEDVIRTESTISPSQISVITSGFQTREVGS